MHPSINSLDFRVTTQTSSAPESPVPSTKNSKIMSEQKKISDDKNLEKRAASPSTSSTVKPPYSYIALSN